MSEPDQRYSPPRAPLGIPDAPRGGSIEATLAGQGKLDFGAVLGEAWERLGGSKRIILGGFIVAYIALFALIWILQSALGISEEPTATGFFMQFVFQIVVTALMYPFFAGVMVVALRHVCGQTISFDMLFGQFDKLVPLLITGLLQSVLVTIGFLLLLLPGIYLSFAYLLAFPLVIDRGMSPWQALETSRKLVTKHWFTVFFIVLTVTILAGISALPLLIGLIWTVPWTALTFAIIYRELAGVSTLAGR